MVLSDAILRKHFDEIDIDIKGVIDGQELYEAVNKMGVVCRKEEVFDLLRDRGFDPAEQTTDYTIFCDVTNVLDGKQAAQREPLSAAKMLQVRRIFCEVDADGSGEVDLDEWITSAKNLGVVMTDQNLEDVFYRSDTDGSGSIDFEEFVGMLEMVKWRDSYLTEAIRPRKGRKAAKVQVKRTLSDEELETIMKAFETYDEDKSGQIDEFELKNAFSSLDLIDVDAAVDRTFVEQKLENERLLTLDGFVRAMQSLILHGEWGMDADDVDSDDERGRGGDEEAGPVMAVGKRRSSVFDPDGGGGADGEMSGMKKWAAHEDVGLSAHEKEAISGIFKSVDTDGSGTIDQGELVTCLEQIGIDPSQDELDQIFAMAGQPKTNNKLAGGDGAAGSEGAEGGAAAAAGAGGGEDSRALSLQDLLNVVSRLRADQAAAPPDQSSSGGASGGGGGGLLGKLIFWKSKEKDDDELKPDELKALQRIFHTFDLDGGGTIDKEELRFMLEEMGMKPTAKDVRRMFRKYDEDGSGEIDYEEFEQLFKDNKEKLMGVADRAAKNELAGAAYDSATLGPIKALSNMWHEEGARQLPLRSLRGLTLLLYNSLLLAALGIAQIIIAYFGLQYHYSCWAIFVMGFLYLIFPPLLGAVGVTMQRRNVLEQLQCFLWVLIPFMFVWAAYAQNCESVGLRALVGGNDRWDVRVETVLQLNQTHADSAGLDLSVLLKDECQCQRKDQWLSEGGSGFAVGGGCMRSDRLLETWPEGCFYYPNRMKVYWDPYQNQTKTKFLSVVSGYAEMTGQIGAANIFFSITALILNQRILGYDTLVKKLFVAQQVVWLAFGAAMFASAFLLLRILSHVTWIGTPFLAVSVRYFSVAYVCWVTADTEKTRYIMESTPQLVSVTVVTVIFSILAALYGDDIAFVLIEDGQEADSLRAAYDLPEAGGYDVAYTPRALLRLALCGFMTVPLLVCHFVLARSLTVQIRNNEKKEYNLAKPDGAENFLLNLIAKQEFNPKLEGPLVMEQQNLIP